MKNFALLIIALICPSLFAQNNIIQLEEVTITKSQHNAAKKIIRNVKKRLRNNFNTHEKLYRVNQTAVVNDNDTVINNNMVVMFVIKSLDNNFTKTIIKDDANKLFRSSLFFQGYDDYRDSPEYWISQVLYNKNLNILGFDFFNNTAGYNFKITYDEKFITVSFTSDDMYSGFFICERETFNLQTLSFKNSDAYPFDVSNSDNGKKTGLKKWIYEVESSTIEFRTDESDKICLANVTVLEKISGYFFEKYFSTRQKI
ncbi:hypothetical protein [Flavobacterium cyanobacteriorum]|nr:hypothetical protein [Flavobacterium cyanobacteriorum]